MARDRGIDWYRQARDDLEWAADTARSGRHAQACFVAQQAAEKAVTAMALRRGYTEVRSHSILEVARALRINDEVTTIAKRLDQYYISARYPDAFATGAPFEYFTAEQSDEAVRLARRMVEIVSATFADG